MNIAHWIARAASIVPDAPAIGLGNRVVHNYRSLAARTTGLSSGLVDRYALLPGDRVGVIMNNVPEYVEVLFALWHAGLVAVPINVKLHSQEFAYILENADISLCITTQNMASAIADITSKPVLSCTEPAYQKLLESEPRPMLDLHPDHLAWIFYTSGTTGRSKGAMLSHRNIMTMTLNYFTDFDRIRPGDTIYHPAPLSHGAGLWMLPHVCAMACNVMPESGRFDPHEIFTDMQHWPNVSMFAAPTMVRRLTLFETDISSYNLKLIVYGGAPMYVKDCVNALDRLGPKLAQLYGQGESPMTITHLGREMIADRAHPDWLYRLGTVGITDSCMNVRIVDEDGNVLPIGEIGEITCHGDPVMQGYWRDEQASAAALKDGWLHTGDIGHFDDKGFLTLTDRSKDLIISGGSNIYPREIEEVLLTASGVEEVSVIARNDPDWGEVVVAYVVGQTNAEKLDKHCLDHIARFKRPKIYRFVSELPKNNYGKILKTVLREKEQALQATPSQDGVSDA